LEAGAAAIIGRVPLTGPFTLPIQFELAAVFLFAITGALLALEERYDVVGVFVLALLSAIGGGLIRDAFFLHRGTPVVLMDPRYLYAIALATLLCLVVGTHLHRFRLLFLLADALGLGIYAVVGAQRALDVGLAFAPAAFIGIASAAGGGVLRDVITRREPLVLKPGEFYILAAVVGLGVFLGLIHWRGMAARDAAWWSIATTFSIRLASVTFNWKTKEARPLLGPRGERPPR
jgi:uncharacterized membrane protein YeiH